MYIDNELSLENKLRFVQQIRNDSVKADEAIELLQQEQIIRGDVVNRIPQIKFSPILLRKKVLNFMVQPMNLVSASLAVAVTVLFFLVLTPQPYVQTNRFVIYRPDVSRAEITGSFTGWQRLPMYQVGESGYWEIVLTVPEGEHRFSYILDGQYNFSDPTIPTKEQDDFGGVNSVLYIGAEA
jgi:hypothetical protein